MPKEHVPDGVPYVKVRDMRGDVIDVARLNRTSPTIAAKYARASLDAGDILLAIRGTYGRVAHVPAELRGAKFTQDSARLALHPSLSDRFVATVLRSPAVQNYFKRVARRVAVRGVNIADVRACPILLPPRAEQEQIALKVEAITSVIDQLESQCGIGTARSGRLRQSILKRAFEGSLVDRVDNKAAESLLDRTTTNSKKPSFAPQRVNQE